jgi:hypothetical protein
MQVKREQKSMASVPHSQENSNKKDSEDEYVPEDSGEEEKEKCCLDSSKFVK